MGNVGNISNPLENISIVMGVTHLCIIITKWYFYTFKPLKCFDKSEISQNIFDIFENAFLQ